MKTPRIRIAYRGAASATRKVLTDLLARAGYSVQTHICSDAALRTGGKYLLVIAPEAADAVRRGHASVTVLTGEARPDKLRTGGASRRGRRPAMNLQQLRAHVRQTQGDVARRAAVSQPQLSRVEGRRDHLVSTVRKYVRALGGDVEVVAVLGAERIVLQDV